MAAVEYAWRDCQHELEWAKRHLRALEKDAAMIRRDRFRVSTGTVTLQRLDHAWAMLAEIRQDLDAFAVALRRLAEEAGG